jgi:hypothetical protein
MKRKETVNASTNTVDSAVDAIKIELKKKDEEIFGLQKDAIVMQTTNKRLEFTMK